MCNMVTRPRAASDSSGTPKRRLDRHVSFRMPEALFRRLTTAAQIWPGGSRSRLAVELVDEGLRMRDHPHIVFRSTAVGRRPAIAGGPEIWHIARVLREYPSTEEGLKKTAELTGLALREVRIANRYYLEFRAEVDRSIDDVDRAAESGAPAEYFRKIS